LVPANLEIEPSADEELPLLFPPLLSSGAAWSLNPRLEEWKEELLHVSKMLGDAMLDIKIFA